MPQFDSIYFSILDVGEMVGEHLNIFSHLFLEKFLQVWYGIKFITQNSVCRYLNISMSELGT